MYFCVFFVFVFYFHAHIHSLATSEYELNNVYKFFEHFAPRNEHSLVFCYTPDACIFEEGQGLE